MKEHPWYPTTHTNNLTLPLHWRDPQQVMVGDVVGGLSCDLFGTRTSNEHIAAVFAVMAACPQHRFLVLTKRPQRAMEWDAWLRTEAWPEQVTPDELNPYAAFHLSDGSAGGHDGIVSMLWNAQRASPAGWDSMWTWPLPNVAIGVSVSDQRTWDALVPRLQEIPARWRIVSAEPLLEPIDATIRLVDRYLYPLHGKERVHTAPGRTATASIDQVIIGAESGPGARPCKLESIQGLAKQVLDAQTTCLECARGHEHTCFDGMAGPALFIKQADVCEACGGAGMFTATPCGKCGDPPPHLSALGLKTARGYAGKVRKGCPEIWVPGHGTQSWQQFPQGWL